METDSSWAERSLPNTAEGAAQLIHYAEASVGSPPSGVRVAVGWLNDEDDDEHISSFLARSGIKHGLTSPDDVRKAALASNVAGTSAMAVAYADMARFGFIYRRNPK